MNRTIRTVLESQRFPFTPAGAVSVAQTTSFRSRRRVYGCGIQFPCIPANRLQDFVRSLTRRSNDHCVKRSWNVVHAKTGRFSFPGFPPVIISLCQGRWVIFASYSVFVSIKIFSSRFRVIFISITWNWVDASVPIRLDTFFLTWIRKDINVRSIKLLFFLSFYVRKSCVEIKLNPKIVFACKFVQPFRHLVST